MLFPAGAVFGILLFGLGLTGVFARSQELVLPLGLPDLPLHLRLDGLSSYFLAVLGVVSTGVSARDRAKTIEVAIAEDAQPQDLLRPGHINPLRARDGGVLVRDRSNDPGCDGRVRITIGTRQQMREAASVLNETLAKLRAGRRSQ